MTSHNPTRTPAAPACQPDGVRGVLRSRPHHERLGFVFARAGKNGPIFVENTDPERKYLISERQMLVLLQFLGGHLSEIPVPMQSTDLRSWLVGFEAQSQPGCKMSRVSPWDLVLLSEGTHVDQSEPALLSPSPRNIHHPSECANPSRKPDTPSESSFHVGCNSMMDVAGGGGNAAACASHFPKTDGAAA